jgi:hypothetical protein
MRKQLNNRYYLQKGEGKKQGAHWDRWAGLWYVDVSTDPSGSKGPDFAKDFDELAVEPDRSIESGSVKPDYSITSERAYVANAVASCWKCHKETKVICIYCETGFIRGKAYKEIIISNIRAMDDSLERQLKDWPLFHYGVSKSTGEALFANHCEHCDEVQDDYFLHCAPNGAFFRMKTAEVDTIQLKLLSGCIRLTGDEGFEP